MPKKKDATKEGVSPEKQEDTEEKKKPAFMPLSSKDNDVMAEIEARRNADFEEETGLKLEEETPEGKKEGEEAFRDGYVDSEEAEKTKKREEKAGEEDEPEKKPDDKKAKKEEAKKEPEAVELAEDALVKVVIDGKEQVVPFSKVKREYQVAGAADRKMAEATELMRKAKSETSTAKEADTEEAEADTKKQDAEADKEIAEKRKAYVEAINYGEGDDIEEALIDYENTVKKYYGGDGASVDAETIERNILDKLQGEQIVKQFVLPPDKGGYGDLWENPRAKRLVTEEVDLLLSNGEPSTWATYEKAGNTIREFLGWKPEVKTEPTKDEEDVDDMKDKKERKKKIINIDSANARTASKATEETPKSSAEQRSNTIADMAKKRPGQQNY